MLLLELLLALLNLLILFLNRAACGTLLKVNLRCYIIELPLNRLLITYLAAHYLARVQTEPTGLSVAATWNFDICTSHLLVEVLQFHFSFPDLFL